MLFIPLLLLAIALYICGQRTYSLLIFFFFSFYGFQIIPDELFETGLGFSKSTDFALVYIFVLFVYGCFAYHDYIPLNRMTYLIAVYLAAILVIIGVNKFVYGIGWGDILKTSRNYFFVLAYYPLRRVEKEEVDRLLKILLYIVLFQSLLFAIQAFTGKAILAGEEDKSGGDLIYRFYNSPRMLYFFIFYTLFVQPLGKKYSTFAGIVLIITSFLPMHRSLIIMVILTLSFGYMLNVGNLKRFIRYLPYALLVAIPLCFILFAQVGSRTISDLQMLREGNFAEIEDSDEIENFEMDSESTFTFRIAHFMERYLYSKTNVMYEFFGLGLMTDDSPYTYNNFNFVIGLPDENGGIYQLDTPDIAWSNFVARYGYVGTVAYLVFYIGLAWFFFVNRKDKLSLSLLLYMLLVLGTSLTSETLYQVGRNVFVLMLFDFIIDKKRNEENNSSNLLV
ncbi:hypothetical protein CE91St1_49850 [Parabacteroides goldsteinii]|uniref:hypothetical protein n=1 Tax=Parabacteroides TaxID=375288 RepID=UPI000FE210A7|nr:MULTISPECIES: hypothetical protein [Parabacteroides]MCM0720837.1 hypothetical protein [Parabacteroides sp. W1-Q-101]GKG75842.1 hypothetical protein CE91St1_49850 [Parabacteroides goldsteinii]GKG80750.1 hypothetical protein CE91St2_39420 [Parabacteroides goldsteinii]